MSRKNKKSYSERKHQTLVDKLFDRLKEIYPYNTIEKNLEYSNRGIKGEFDIIRISETYRVYYEIKSGPDKKGKATQKALYQFRKVARAFPEYNWKFVLIQPNRWCGLYIRKFTYKDLWRYKNGTNKR